MRSSGKAAYFLAIFPYVVLTIILVRAVTLEGSIAGIMYFITPNWKKLWTLEIWYHAVAQCFFSLTICFGAVIMFASHNKFEHDIYRLVTQIWFNIINWHECNAKYIAVIYIANLMFTRDAVIVTTLDTFTSLLGGCTIFAILGNLSYELNVKDINTVVRGGTGLAFISYPDAIAKFTVIPQFFGILFFVMLFILGIGSEVGLTSSIISVIHDQFPKVNYWYIALGTCFCEFLIGLIYVTPVVNHDLLSICY